MSRFATVPSGCLLSAVLSIAVLAVLGGAPAVASPTGINSFSGQNGYICNICHGGGLPPVVTLSGPTEVFPGTVVTYTLTIAIPPDTTTGQQAAGLDVAATGGTLTVTDPGTQILFGDLTHTAPRSMDRDRDVIFAFDWQAPVSTGDFTIFAAGNAVNLNGDTSGDAPAGTTLTVSVGALTSTPGEVSGDGQAPLRVTGHDPVTGLVSIEYQSGCATTDAALYYGPLEAVGVYGYTGEACGIGAGGDFGTVFPGSGDYFFLVVGSNGPSEGSYGRAREGVIRAERPPFGGGLCGVDQALADRCDPR